MVRRAALLAVLAAGTLSGQSGRRVADERAVRAVVDSFFKAVEREQWDSAARFVDTSKFARYVREQIQYARSAVPPRPTTVEEMMAGDTTMPRAVAEWEVKHYRAAVPDDPSYMLTAEFVGVKSPDDLSRLTTSQALARWIAAKDLRVQIREAARRDGCPDSVATYPFDRRTVHAVGFDGDTTAYAILLREPRRSSDFEMFSGDLVLVLHPRGRTWRLEAREQLLNPGGMGVAGCLK